MPKEKYNSRDLLAKRFVGSITHAKITEVFKTWNREIQIKKATTLHSEDPFSNYQAEIEKIIKELNKIMNTPELNPLAKCREEYKKRYDADNAIKKAETSLSIESNNKEKKTPTKDFKAFFNQKTTSRKKTSIHSYKNIIESNYETIFPIVCTWEAGRELKDAVAELKEASFKKEINNDTVAELITKVLELDKIFLAKRELVDLEYKTACLMHLEQYIKNTTPAESKTSSEKEKKNQSTDIPLLERVQTLYLQAKFTEQSFPGRWEDECKNLDVALQNGFNTWKNKFEKVPQKTRSVTTTISNNLFPTWDNNPVTYWGSTIAEISSSVGNHPPQNKFYKIQSICCIYINAYNKLAEKEAYFEKYKKLDLESQSAFCEWLEKKFFPNIERYTTDNKVTSLSDDGFIASSTSKRPSSMGS